LKKESQNFGQFWLFGDDVRQLIQRGEVDRLEERFGRDLVDPLVRVSLPGQHHVSNVQLLKEEKNEKLLRISFVSQ
jgi:hypothetical protein